MTIPYKPFNVFNDCIPVVFPLQYLPIFRFKKFKTCIILIYIWNFYIAELLQLVQTSHVMHIKIAVFLTF